MDFASPETLKIELSLQRRANFEDFASLLWWSTFHRFWDRFLIDFWSIFESQNRYKNRFENDKIFDQFFIDFGSILGPNLGAPRRAKSEPKLGFWKSWGPLGAKMAPRPLQEASGIDFWSILDQILMIFGWFLVRFWMIFGSKIHQKSIADGPQNPRHGGGMARRAVR